VLLVALCVAGSALALVAYRSEKRAQAGLLMLYSGRPAAEIQAQFDSARTLNPDSVFETSEALFLVGRPEDARRILDRAIRREPENVQLWLALSRVDTRDRNDAGARRAYARARELDSQLPGM
jgi:predicted Zn-dependent protease